MRRNPTGYTLIETLVVLLVAGVSMSVVVPGMSTLMRNQQVVSFTNAFVLGLAQGRSEAIKRNTRVVLCKSADGEVCAVQGGWEQGWILFADLNNNARREPQEELIRHQGPAPGALFLTGNLPVSKYVSYGATGTARMVSGAFQSGTFTVCPGNATGVDARQVILSATGNPRTARAPAATWCS